MASTHPLGLDLSLFPIRKNLIYMNHAGTAPITKPAADRLHEFADEVSGYASAVYDRWDERMRKTRQDAARLLGATPDEIAFVKNTTQELNLVALGLQWNPGDVVIAEEKTFPANWLAWKDAAQARGAKLWVWPERNYRYELEDLEARLKQGGVKLVAATSANFATGFRQDIEEVGRLCKQYGALLCVDAIQTLGVFPLDVKKCQIDFLSADGHKWLMGPEGAGIFYTPKKNLSLIDETLVGWMGREGFTEFDRLDLPPDPTTRRFEEGAPNVGGIMALGGSLDLFLSVGIERIQEHNRSLCRELVEGLEDIGWKTVCPKEEQFASSIVPAFKEGVDCAQIVAKLWENGKIWAAARRGFLRLSPHFYQTSDDIQAVLATLKKVG
jgi:selenocysteine lyase/cysteine desulfurase